MFSSLNQTNPVQYQMEHSGQFELEKEKILVLKKQDNLVSQYWPSPLTDTQIMISRSPMRTLGGRPSKDTWSRLRSVCVLLHENGTRTDVEIKQYALMRCGPLFNSPQTFSVIPKPSFAQIAIHTFTLLLYMQEGSYRLVFFLFFFFLGSIQSKHTTTFSPPHTPMLQWSVGNQTQCRTKLCVGSDVQFATLCFVPSRTDFCDCIIKA